MSVTAKCLINAAFATAADVVVYTAPGATHTIIDKFTATNTDVGALTLNVNIIPSGGSVGASNLVIDVNSIATTAIKDFTELQNHILNPGDQISIKGSSASKIVVRASGREIT